MFMGTGVKRGKTEHVPLLLQRVHTPGNLVPPGCLRGQWKWGKKQRIQAKVLGLSLLLVEFSFLGESGVAGRWWVWRKLCPCTAGVPPCLP